MNNSYLSFKQAFIDRVLIDGYDVDFIEGFFKRAEEEYSNWEKLARAAYQDNTELYKQAYTELAAACDVMYKQADEMGPGQEILGLLQQLGSGTAGMFGQEGGAGLGGALVGGGGGMLLGLILSQLFNIPLPIALSLGALGGGALGYNAAGTPGGQQKYFGVPQPAADPSVAAGTDVPAAKTQIPETTDVPAAPANPTAERALGSAQQASNQVASGAPTLPPAQAPAAPAVVPPATQPPAPNAFTFPPVPNSGSSVNAPPVNIQPPKLPGQK